MTPTREQLLEEALKYMLFEHGHHENLKCTLCNKARAALAAPPPATVQPAGCVCVVEHGDSDCPVHPTCAKCGCVECECWPPPAQFSTAEVSYFECDHCGDVAIESKDGMFSDGDGGACASCGMPGQVSMDAETDPYWSTNQEEGDRCNRMDCEDCAGIPLETRAQPPLVQSADGRVWAGAPPAKSEAAKSFDCPSCGRLLWGYDGKIPLEVTVTGGLGDKHRCPDKPPQGVCPSCLHKDVDCYSWPKGSQAPAPLTPDEVTARLTALEARVDALEKRKPRYIAPPVFK